MTDFNDQIAIKADPLVETALQDFPWTAIYERLDGATQGLTESDLQQLGKALARILEFLGEPLKASAKRRRKSRRPNAAFIQAGRRVAALMWLLNPSAFNGIPTSLTQLSASFGLCRTPLSDLAAEATRIFGVRNRYQAHAMNKSHTARLKKGTPRAA